MHDQSYPLLAQTVRQRRSALGLKQTELAELARCSPRFVHTVEAGKTTLRLDKLVEVLSVLGLGLKLEPGRGLRIDERLREAP